MYAPDTSSFQARGAGRKLLTNVTFDIVILQWFFGILLNIKYNIVNGSQLIYSAYLLLIQYI